METQSGLYRLKEYVKYFLIVAVLVYLSHAQYGWSQELKELKDLSPQELKDRVIKGLTQDSQGVDSQSCDLTIELVGKHIGVDPSLLVIRYYSFSVEHFPSPIGSCTAEYIGNSGKSHMGEPLVSFKRMPDAEFNSEFSKIMSNRAFYKEDVKNLGDLAIIVGLPHMGESVSTVYKRGEPPQQIREKIRRPLSSQEFQKNKDDGTFLIVVKKDKSYYFFNFLGRLVKGPNFTVDSAKALIDEVLKFKK